MTARLRVVLSTLFLAAAVMVVAVPVALAASGRLIEIPLRKSNAFPAAHGKAKYKVDGGQREFEMEAEDIRGMAGKKVNVFVNGNKLATRVVRLGAISVERSTELGQRVPRISKGSTVRVRTLGGTLIVSGTF